MSANDRQEGGSHYRSPIQHWDYVLANNIPYLEAQVIKYLTRWRKKNGMLDVLKARHFLDKLIEVERAACPHEFELVQTSVGSGNRCKKCGHTEAH